MDKELLITLLDVKLEVIAVLKHLRIFSSRKDSNRVPSKYIAEVMTARLFVITFKALDYDEYFSVKCCLIVG
jgi:hypothetical protein